MLIAWMLSVPSMTPMKPYSTFSPSTLSPEYPANLAYSSSTPTRVFSQAILTQLVAQGSERDPQQLGGMRAVPVGLCQRNLDELLFHLAHGTARFEVQARAVLPFASLRPLSIRSDLWHSWSDFWSSEAATERTA